MGSGRVSAAFVARTRTRTRCVYRGRRGRTAGCWLVTCLGVRETLITDLDGGGLRVYPGSHPAARQYTARRAELLWPDGDEPEDSIGVLYRAHLEAVDDWIPFDRYSTIRACKDGTQACRGPEFLMRAYAKALRTRAVTGRLIARPLKARFRLSVLHFGESYIVAADFKAVPKR